MTPEKRREAGWFPGESSEDEPGNPPKPQDNPEAEWLPEHGSEQSAPEPTSQESPARPRAEPVEHPDWRRPATTEWFAVAVPERKPAFDEATPSARTQAPAPSEAAPARVEPARSGADRVRPPGAKPRRPGPGRFSLLRSRRSPEPPAPAEPAPPTPDAAAPPAAERVVETALATEGGLDILGAIKAAVSESARAERERADREVAEVRALHLAAEKRAAGLEASLSDAVRAHEAALEELGASLASSEGAREAAEAAHRAERRELVAKLEAAERAFVEQRERGRQAEEDAAKAVADSATRLDELSRRCEELGSALETAERTLAEERERRREAEERAERTAADSSARTADLTWRLEDLKRALRLAEERTATAVAGGRRDESGRLEVNTVTVEGLRELGLSVTQAARLVSHREARGGFGSIEDLAGVPGLPESQLNELLRRLYVDPELTRP